MAPLVLFYNLNNEKGRKIKFICLKLKIRIRQVLPEDYTKPVGVLAGLKGFAPSPDTSPDPPEHMAFTDEMLVMKDFHEALLDRFLSEMKRAKIERIALKAILTPENIGWDSFALHDELKKEHEAMTKEPPAAN